MIIRQTVDPVVPVTSSMGHAARDRAVEQMAYAGECERFLDYWYGGSAQRERLKRAMERRGGTVDEPRSRGVDDEALDLHLTDDGRAIREETTELITLRYARKICQDIGVLYASDDLSRRYTVDGEEDAETTGTMAWYHAPRRGGLEAILHIIDSWLPGLRVVGLMCSWSEELGQLVYEFLPPHWFHFWEHHRYPSRAELAYAVAYSEPEVRDEDGRRIPGNVWTAYVRPALPSDPPDAPTWLEGYERTGRMVRYVRGGAPWSDPWPLPEPGSSEIIDGEDYGNPLVADGGWEPKERRFVWSPIILHAAEPFVDSLRLPVADDICQINEELDQGVTEALHTANLQMKGIPVMRGPGDIPEVMGPSHPVHVTSPEGDFEFKSPLGQPVEHMSALHRVLQISGILSHLPVDSLALQPPAITTGPALLLRRSDLIAERSRRTVDATRPEVMRFELERVLHNANGVAPARPVIPWDAEMTVHWGEMSTPVEWGTRLSEMAQERSLGLTSRAEMIQERHGVCSDEALRRIVEIDEEQQTTGSPSAPGRPTGADDGVVPDRGDPDEGIQVDEEEPAES